MMKTLILSSFAALSATASFAETTYVNGSASFTKLSYAGDSIEVFALGTEFEQSIGNSVVGASFSNSTVDGDDYSTASVYGEYAISNGLRIVGSYGIDFSNGESTDTDYALGLEYDYNNYTFGVVHGVTESDGVSYAANLVFASYEKDNYEASLFFAVDEDDATATGVTVGFETDLFEIDGAYLTASDDTGDLSIYLISGDYKLSETFKVGGVYSYLTADGDVTIAALTAGYEVYENVWLEGSMGQISDGEDTIDTLGISLTYEFGNKGSQARQAEQAIQDTIGDNLWLR